MKWEADSLELFEVQAWLLLLVKDLSYISKLAELWKTCSFCNASLSWHLEARSWKLCRNNEEYRHRAAEDSSSCTARGFQLPIGQWSYLFPLICTAHHGGLRPNLLPFGCCEAELENRSRYPVQVCQNNIICITTPLHLPDICLCSYTTSQMQALLQRNCGRLTRLLPMLDASLFWLIYMRTAPFHTLALKHSLKQV